MDELAQELSNVRATTAEVVRQLRAATAAELEDAHASARSDAELAREKTDRLVTEATSQLRRAEQEAARAQQSETAAIQRVDRAQAQAAEEAARIRADAQRERDELHAANDARLAATEEALTALRIRAERAETNLDTTRAENHRLTEQLAQATADNDEHPHDPASTPAPRRARKAPTARKPSNSPA